MDGLRRSRVFLFGVALGGAWLLPVPPAWAPHVPQLTVTPAQARAGDEVAVVGTRGYGFTNPVEVRFNAVDGPVLGKFVPDNQPYAAWGPGTVRIPADTKPGTYTLYATQVLADLERHIRGIPVRAVIDVVGPGGVPVLARDLAVPGEEGTPGLTENEPPGLGSLVLVALAVGGVAMLAAGGVAMAGRRRPDAAPLNSPAS
ncbi:MAG: hypothetical protein Q8K72_11465 [Acidimicrobiales bacterium]|nr:hypothetical protein [Acidimicrobiales bacterium]